MADVHHVVVDGSNLATEGRSSPSLRQLDEAVRAYASEDPDASIIVVVDATFEHRVSDSERDEVRAAMLNGEIVSPPAGAIGRGDAFVLRIAERTGATVLSNDSFQEFHGEHPWLFSDGRLVGGKPVPGVGWIFTPRLPIRGPKSRAATAEARSSKDPDSPPAKAAELARAAKKAAKKAAKSTKKAAKRPAPEVDTSWPITPATPPPGRAKLDPAFSSAIDEAVEEAMHPPQPGRARPAAKTHQAEKKSAPQKSAKAKKDAGRGRAEDKPAPSASAASRTQKKRRVAPPPAVNEPLTFINFVAAFPVGSALEGEVVSFTSHGAMVDVSLPVGDTMHCYIPLTAMGSPPPTKARQVLKKGEVRSFVLAGLDPPRRVAELALPELPATAASASASEPQTARRGGRPRGKGAAKVTEVPAASTAATATGKAGAKKARPPKETAAKKEGAKKAAAATAAAKKAPPKKMPVKKSAATKSGKKAATKKAAAKKAAAPGTKAPDPAKKAAKVKARAPKRAGKAKSA